MKTLANALATFVYAGILFLGLYHTIVDQGAYPGLAPRANLIEYGLAPIYLVAMLALWSRRVPYREVFLVGAPFAAFVHGLALTIGGATEGRRTIALAALAGLLSARAHLGKLIRQVEDTVDKPAARYAA